MALEAIKFHLFFKSLHLFTFFLCLFTSDNERSAVGSSMWNVENKQFPCKITAGWVQDFKNKPKIRQTHDETH
jgi:hypothetical protein